MAQWRIDKVLVIKYYDSVVGPGSPHFDTAYWDISYVRTYTSAAVTPSPTEPSSTSSTSGVIPSSPVAHKSHKSSAQSLGAICMPLWLSFVVYTVFVVFVPGEGML